MISTAQAPSEPASPVALVDRVETVRLDWCRFLMTRAALFALLGLLIVGGLLALADWIWIFSQSLRLAVWLLLGLAVVALFCHRILLPRQPFSQGDTASGIESAFPQLGQRICTTLEYAKPTPQTMPAWPSLVRALALDTEQRTADLAFDRVVPWRMLRWPATAAAGLGAVLTGMLLLSQQARIAAMRLFLIPVHYTQLEVEPGDQTVKVGADLTVRATLSGRPVASVELVYRKAEGEGEWTTISLAPDDENAGGRPRLLGALETTLKNCQDNLHYRVIAGPVESPTYELRVLHPLVLQKTEATIDPPAYTRQKATVVAEGDFRVIEGSRVQLRFTLDRAPQTAELRLFATAPPDVKAPPQAMPLPPLALDVQENVLTGELASVTAPVQYELQAEAADGMRLEPKRFRIQVQPDRKPTIRFVKPQGEIEVTPTTEVTVRVAAGDDFGLSKVGIVYQVGNGPKKTLRLDEDPKQPISLTTLATLYLEEHPLSYRDSVTYYAFAEDNYPSGPHRVTTELGFIDIRPYKRTYQVLKTGGTCMGRCGALEELIRRQRANLQGTFAQCEQAHPDKPTVERIAKAERELADATAEFAAKLAEKAGPVPCMASAAKAMQSATAELDQKNLKPARGHEETALAELIKARQNLRQMLSESSSANQCRQLDSEQQQKMRPPKQSKPQNARKKPAADLQHQIEKLAKTERQCCQEIESQCTGRQGQSSQASQSNQSPAKSDNLAERQEKAAQQAVELEQVMRDDEAMTDLARQRMSRARRTIRSSAENMRGGKQSEAGSQAKHAAEQLESLSRQVAGLKSPEMAGKLAAADGLARRLAGEQRARQRQASAEDQRRAAEDTRTLGDFLQQFQRDASESDAKLARALRDATEANPPVEIADEMNRAAEALESGRRDEARRETKQTAERLDALARQLGAARREFVQPQLEKLLAAEKQAAELQNRLSSPVDEQQRAEAEKKMGELETSLEPLRPADERIAEEARKLEEAVHQRAGWSNWHEVRPGYYKPSDLSVVAIQRIAKALRVRVQEIILKDALLDRDSPVPPQYQKQVETYYRVLSEDLR